LAAGYLDWALGKLRSAPDSACAFWVDVNQLLSRANGGSLDDVDQQTISDEHGRSWSVVRFRANPIPARRLLSEPGRHVIVWCVGVPGTDYTDLTALEDFLGRAWHILEIDLETLASEVHPGLDLPKGLSAILKGITFDPFKYVDALWTESSRGPLSILNSIATLVSLTVPNSPRLDFTSAERALATCAFALASADTPNSRRLVETYIDHAAKVDAGLGALLRAVLEADAREVILATGIAAGLARLDVSNIGPILTGEGLCPADLRGAFESAAGRWEGMARASDEECAILLGAVEPLIQREAEDRLCSILSNLRLDTARVASEPSSLFRAVAALSQLPNIVRSGVRVADVPVQTTTHRDLLDSIDRLTRAILTRDALSTATPPDGSGLESVATAFAASPASIASLDLARGHLALNHLTHRLSPHVATEMRSLIEEAGRTIKSALSRWDEVWASLIANDIGAYLHHPLQGWKRTKALAEKGTQCQSWMIVFDGLRYDLWSAIVLPILKREGWRSSNHDVSFAYLPSLTEVSRRTLIGASPSAARGNEASLAQEVAGSHGMQSTYVVRTEGSSGTADSGSTWNVRVFSWPDKLVHSDLMDLGTLADQFEAWLLSEFVPWLRSTVPKEAQLAISTDHGFAALDPADAIGVTAPGDGDHNLPRVLPRPDPSLGLVVNDGSTRVTIATSSRWFKGPGGHHWKFAHGGCTLFETLVPFAVMTGVRAGHAEIEITGLPASIEVDEGHEVDVAFAVKVVGGAAMFPKVVARTNLRSVRSDEIEVGVERPYRLRLLGEEGLTKFTVVVTSGTDRAERTVDVNVKLAKVKRTTLDIDI